METLCKRATSVARLTNFSFEFFYEIFTEDASLPLLYHGAKKSKMTKNSNLRFVAMNMMNKCAKFHKDSPSGKKAKLYLARAVELSETAVFVYNFVWKPYASEQLRWHIWPTFPLNFFMKFSQKMPLYLFYTMVQKSQKWPKTQIYVL